MSYERDNNGKIAKISANNTPVIQNITYKPFGPVKAYEIGDNILTVTRTYNDRYLVKNITAGSLDYHYDYYDDGSVWKITGPPSPSTLTVGSTDIFPVAGSDKIAYSQGYHHKDYHYRDIIDDFSYTFAYNDDNRLQEYKRENLDYQDTQISRYGYDASGRRVRKEQADGSVVLYHYDINNNLISETDEVGTPLKDYIYLGSEPVAMIDYGTGGGTYYYINDHLGTPQQMVDDNGAVVWQAAYLPFGKAQVFIEDVVNNLRFAGQYYDEESGLHYNWNRYYDPETGRYMTADPIGLDGGINLYGYVSNDPVNFVDPTGTILASGTAAFVIYVAIPVAARYGPAIARGATAAAQKMGPYLAPAEEFAEGFFVPSLPPPSPAGLAGYAARKAVDKGIDRISDWWNDIPNDNCSDK